MAFRANRSNLNDRLKRACIRLGYELPQIREVHQQDGSATGTTRRRSRMVGVAARSGHHYRLDPQCLDTQSTVRGIGTQPFTIDAARAAVTFGGERGRIVPLDAYRGVSVRMERLPEPGHVRVWLELLHTDSRLTVPLMAADDSDAVVADWQEWGRLL